MISSEAKHEASGSSRVTSRVKDLAELVGAHPDALVAIFRAGTATDPNLLGETPSGRFLAFGCATDMALGLRPLVRLLSGPLALWKGMTFDHGGNSGQNVILGQRLYRFRAEVGPSLIDGRAALVLTYSEPSHHNPRLLHRVRNELRTVSGGRFALGLTMTARAAAPSPIVWFGLEPSSR